MNQNSEIPNKQITPQEAIDIFKKLLVQQPLITVTELGQAIVMAIVALEGSMNIRVKCKVKEE